MEYVEFSGKTVDDAITEACQNFTVTSDRLDYEIIDKGSSGFLGIGFKNAVIKARVRMKIHLLIQKSKKQFLKKRLLKIMMIKKKLILRQM